MRPVNLIPPEDRRGDRAPLRAGGLSYVVVGALAAVLVAVLALVMTQNSITDRESEIAELEVARDAAAARAAALAPYAEFASLEEQREQTIASLAQSRFDWERVLRELALVIPANVKLDELQAATAGGSEAGGDETSTGTTANAGSAPSLSMSGCTPTHDDVAAFVAALEDIDGVTRVGLESSTKSKAAETDATQAPASGEAGGGCSVGETSFALLAVFDGAATAIVPAEPTAPAATATAPAETNSTEEQVAESQNAVDLVPGGGAMKATDRSILLGLVILGLLAVFWFMLLSPKRERMSELDQQVSALQTEVSQQQQLASFAEEAEADYASNYERLIVLGKAAPADGDTPSLLAQLTERAEKAGTEFDSLTAGGETPMPAAPATSETTTDQNAAAAEAVAATPAPATEASAALLPLGASVGPAGLGVLPYTLEFRGDFFSMADLLADLDKNVGTGKSVEVDGRLLTINGFTMTPDAETGDLAVELSITSYVLPESQGLTAGATPTAPAPSVPAPTPTTVPTATASTP